jgi:hypothetical protein
MLRIVTVALFATALYAQDGVKPVEKPPAKVDQALRARATQLYQDFVKGQFIDAESLVAPDSKDYFASIRKDRYVSFEIKRIDFSEKFKRALVGAVCERNVMMVGFAGHPLKTPVESLWKLERGKWYWFVDRDAPRMTPFGIMGAAMAAAGIGAPVTQPAQPAGLPAPAALPTLDVALHKVSADKESLALKAGESAGVTFSNSAQGEMGVSLYGDPPAGIEVTPARADMQQNGKATLTVKALAGAKSAVLKFQVFPTGEFIAIKVVID